jgi:hypothetical protein
VISLFSLPALAIAASFTQSQGALIIAFGLFTIGYITLYKFCKKRIAKQGYETTASSAAGFATPKPSAPLSTARE